MRNLTPDNAATKLLYAGEMYDGIAAQYYLRARWYSPVTGRFNRMDPFAGNNRDPQSLHKYLYAHCNPINSIDPTGLWTTTQIVVVTGIIGAVIGAIIGGYLGYKKTGSLFSWQTLKLALLGAFIGFGVGATIGATIAYFSGISAGLAKGAFSIVTRAISKISAQAWQLVTAVGLGAGGSMTLVLFGTGILFGILTAVTFPESTLNGLATGVGFISSAAVISTFGSSTIYAIIGTSAPVATMSFVLGFNVGFWPTWSIRKIFSS